jgi:hypothetical protein
MSPRRRDQYVKKHSVPDGVSVIRDILKASRPRPQVADPVGKKNQYAVRFAEHMAKRIANDLAPRLRSIQATTKRTAGSLRGQKQLDVNFSTPQHGLALGISLKSVHLRDAKSGRYTHNMKRNEEELRIEASGYHKRQPYAVMIGVLFVPFDSCDDAKKDNPSSFGSWVRHLRPYCGRGHPDDEIDRFEKLYVAMYEPDGSDLRFFDIESDPPRNRRPPQDGELLAADGRARRLLTYAEFLDGVYHRYLQRNSAEFRWADGQEAPLEVDEVEEEEQDNQT